MAGKSPRLRAKTIADVYYKEELDRFESEIKEKDLELANLFLMLKKRDEEIIHLKKEYEKKIDEHERIAVTNKNIKTDYEQFMENYTKQLESYKQKIKELGGEVDESKSKKKKKD